MLFDLRSIYFLSLIVGSLAAPLPSFGSSETDDSSFVAPLEAWNPSQADYEDVLQLERRTAGLIPSSVTCGTTRYGSPVVIPRQKILNALLAAEKDATSSRGKTYPAFYGNLNGRFSVLKDADALDGQRRGDLREQPVGTTQTWTGGDLKYVGASMYRVIYDNKIMDPEQSYIGMVYHERDEEGAFLPCIEAVEPACPPTTARRSLWDLVRRAVGKQPTKSPASCKKPAPKKSAPKQAARWTPPSPPSPPSSPEDSTLNRPQNASPRPPKRLGPQESSASFSPPAPPSPPSSPAGPSLNIPHSSPSPPNTLTPDMPARQRPAPIPQIY